MLPPITDQGWANGLAFARAAEIRGAEVARGRTLAIGDGPATDMLGANRQGIDGLFIGRSAWNVAGYLDILAKCAAKL